MLATEPDAPPLAAISLQIPTGGEGLNAVHALLGRLWAWSWGAPIRLPDARWRGEFASAVAEIAANIVRHACPAVGDRCDPRLMIAIFPERIEATFTDRGAPCLAPIPSGPPAHSPDHLEGWPENGLGLGLARAALDDLRYERTSDGENRWLLRKRLARPNA